MRAGIVVVIAALLLMLTSGCVTRGVWGGKRYNVAGRPTLTMPPDGSDVLVRYDESCFNYPFSRSKETQPRAYWLLASTNHTHKTPPQFVDVVSASNWVSVPIVPLDVTRFVTKRADRQWLRHDERWIPFAREANKPVHIPPERPHSISVGTNRLGQDLYITNYPPVHSCYWKFSTSPERYVAVTTAPPDHGYYVVSYFGQFILCRNEDERIPFKFPAYSTYERTTVWRVVLAPLAMTADTVLIGTAVAGVLAVGGAAGAAAGGGPVRF